MEDLFDYAEEKSITKACAYKALTEALNAGVKEDAATRFAGQVFDKISRKRAKSFLQKAEQRLEQLSNQDIVNLLLSLIASGMSFDSEEELEYWLAKMETLALQRIGEYLAFSAAMNSAQGHDRKKFMFLLQNMDSRHIENIKEMAQLVEFLHKRKEPSDKNGNEYKQWAEIFKQLKQAQEAAKQDLRQRNVLLSQNQQSSHHDNPLEQLKNKMHNAGVIEGGNYWNDTIGEYITSPDKTSFVSRWSADVAKIEKETGKLDKSEIERREEEKRQREREQAAKQEQKEYINSEFSNPANQRAAETMCERAGIKLDGENIGRVKVVVKSGKQM